MNESLAGLNYRIPQRLLDVTVMTNKVELTSSTSWFCEIVLLSLGRNRDRYHCSTFMIPSAAASLA